MLFTKFQKTYRSTPKGSLAPACCLGISLIFALSIFMSGCVVHHKGHGYKGHGNKHGHGHYKKGHIKIKPHVGISISPMIVIDD